MNIVYFGYDMFAGCLKQLIDDGRFNILKIFSFPSDGYFDFFDEIKALADANNIPFTTEKINEDELKLLFSKEGCELAVSAGYQYRIPMDNIENFKGINIHPSLLPEGRGPWPLPWAILKGLSKTGITAHKIAPEFDRGDILLQKEIEVSKDETYDTLQNKITKQAPMLLKQLFSNLDFYFENAKPQGTGEYLKEPEDALRTVYKDTPKEKRELILRAFGEKYTIFKNKNERK